MRALCGAIMAAGAFIGLGLTAIGVGMRYNHNFEEMHWQKLDPALLVIIVLLVLAGLTGIGVAFMGLMYHHHRRHVELHGHHHPPTSTTPHVPA